MTSKRLDARRAKTKQPNRCAQPTPEWLWGPKESVFWGPLVVLGPRYEEHSGNLFLE